MQNISPQRSGKISASALLERFLFTPDMQYAPIGKLSGGEKRRLYLLGVLAENANVLLFDEAGNNLDIPTLTILEDYLNSFSGIVITVSHDRTSWTMWWIGSSNWTDRDMPGSMRADIQTIWTRKSGKTTEARVEERMEAQVEARVEERMEAQVEARMEARMEPGLSPEEHQAQEKAGRHIPQN